VKSNGVMRQMLHPDVQNRIYSALSYPGFSVNEGRSSSNLVSAEMPVIVEGTMRNEEIRRGQG
jgi:hypothetical protein